MASQMVVPASKDTLFMRGFSARLSIQEIREFFTEEGGRCSVEFHKEADTKDRLYVALRFDTKDIAKDVLNRFDNKDVLGDRITISWFKDLRRARQKEMQRRRSGWSPQRGGGGSYWERDRFDRDRRWRRSRSPIGTRFRKYDRSSSRSRSASRSRSRSRSKSMSRSPSVDRNRSRTPEQQTKRSKKHRSRSISESQERGRARDRSSPSPRVDKMEQSGVNHDDIEGRWRERSMERSPPPARSPSPIREKYSDRGSEPRRGGRGVDDHGSERVSYDASPPRLGKQVRSMVTTVDPATQKSPPPLGGPEGGDVYKDGKDYREERGATYGKQSQPGGRFYDEPAFDNNQYSAEKEGRRRGDRYSDNYKPGRDGYQDYDQDRASKRSYSPGPTNHGSGRDVILDDRARQAPVSPPYLQQEEPSFRRDEPLREHRLDDRVSKSRDVPMLLVERERSPDPPRQKRMFDDEGGRPQWREYEARRTGPAEDMEVNKRKYAEESPVLREHRRILPDDRAGPLPPVTKPQGGRLPGGGRYKVKDEVSSLPDDTDMGKSHGSGSLNGGMSREVDRGAAGLPQDQLSLVKDKKEEIEKSYRQDCETFASVVKMLVSKDPSLEDRLQQSLRENLKEIGQRCIYELREYMDRVRTEEDAKR